MLQSDQKERDVNLDIATEEDFTVPKRYIKPKYTSTSPTVQVNNRFAVLTNTCLCLRNNHFHHAGRPRRKRKRLGAGSEDSPFPYILISNS